LGGLCLAELQLASVSNADERHAGALRATTTRRHDDTTNPRESRRRAVPLAAPRIARGAA
jgi:hypothetical protein